MSITLLPSKFPAADVTDGQYLYRSLGSFWTQIFQDKTALQGYTLGMAEELIQAYYKLTEVLQQYSVKEIPLLHREKWQPLLIKKSEFNKAPFVFESDAAVFGVQPESDQFYANQLFRFGYSKQTDGKSAFSFTPKFNLKKFSLIANRLIAPTALQIHGVDVFFKNGTLFFNNDLFNNPYIPKTTLAGELGVPATFIDLEGKIQQDELIILWIYHAELDNEALYANFGTLFDLILPTSEAYKEILKALMNLAVEAPTISALSTAFAALAATPVVIEPIENVEDIYQDANHAYVVTDKNVYRLPRDQELNDDVLPGNKLKAGTIISTNVKVTDVLVDPVWWKTEIQSSKLAFASYVFDADNKNQLFFENDTKELRYIVGRDNEPTYKRLVFPVQGRPEDVEAFQIYINEESRRSEILSKLHMAKDVSSSLYINPVDFVFENFVKSNTLLLKLEFYSSEQLSLFFNLLPALQKYLPSHVYILIYLKLQLPVDQLANLNNAFKLNAYPSTVFSCDGAIASTGARPGSFPGDENYYKDYINRVFCVAMGPYKNTVQGNSATKAPLHVYDNLDEISADNSTGAGFSAGIKSGMLRTEIPDSVRSPGESTYRTPSNREIPAILLIDF